jgi:hypothetical protein
MKSFLRVFVFVLRFLGFQVLQMRVWVLVCGRSIVCVFVQIGVRVGFDMEKEKNRFNKKCIQDGIVETTNVSDGGV